MIGYLKGNLSWQKDNSIIIEINGVGYQVEVVNDYFLPEIGAEIEIYVYTYVREDAIKLFGFQKVEEKELFITLLGVAGIGPRGALNIIADLPYNEFINAILTENITVLKQISGIGPKTAQRLILELKSKVDKLAVAAPPLSVAVNHDSELYEALQSLGYSAREIDKAVRELKMGQKLGLEEKLRTVLSYLGKGS